MLVCTVAPFIAGVLFRLVTYDLIRRRHGLCSCGNLLSELWAFYGANDRRMFLQFWLTATCTSENLMEWSINPTSDRGAHHHHTNKISYLSHFMPHRLRG